MDCSMPGFLVLHHLQSSLKLVSIELVMPFNHIILCRPLLLLPSVLPSIRVFSSESALHIRWPSIRVSASASVLPMNIQVWFPLGLPGLIFLQFKGLSRVFSNTTVQKHPFFSIQPSLWPNSHIYTWLLETTIALTIWAFVGKAMSLNMLSRLVIAFLPRGKRLLISWLQSPFAVIWEPKKIKSATVSIVSPFIFHEVMGLDAMILVF